MGPEHIHQKSRNNKEECHHEHLHRTSAEDVIAHADTDSQATLPPQHEGALRCTSLAVTAQLDEEQQEPTAHQSYSQAQKGRCQG